ncbi:MAG: sigma-70 family RNA polymerase sigma factor [Verrucomicrobiaceae bacterium]
MSPSDAQFTRLWTGAFPKVAAFVASMVYDVHDRDDVLQDCAVAAMTSFARYDSDRPFAAWAIGVARNQVRLYLRRKSNDPHIFDDDALDALVQAFAKPQPNEQEQFAQLESCIGQLDDRARELCEYRYFHNLKPAAIAEQIGMNPNAVAKALQRIREKLRHCIETSTRATS